MYFVAIGNILWALGICYDHSAHFVIIWYIFSGFGIMDQEKSGNPARKGALNTRKEEEDVEATI
jgi:hypothetical protein